MSNILFVSQDKDDGACMIIYIMRMMAQTMMTTMMVVDTMDIDDADNDTMDNDDADNDPMDIADADNHEGSPPTGQAAPG